MEWCVNSVSGGVDQFCNQTKDGWVLGPGSGYLGTDPRLISLLMWPPFMVGQHRGHQAVSKMQIRPQTAEFVMAEYQQGFRSEGALFSLQKGKFCQ